MDITQMSILHHIGIVLILLWIFSAFNFSHPLIYFSSFVYLFLVNERYSLRLKRKLHFHERKQSYQKRLLSDSETVRWLNHAVEKIWPICMENIASQKILLPIIPWFLHKYKPWTAKKAVIENLYLGRNPPMFTEMRVLGQSGDDDHLVLELGMNFLSADDMNAALAVKLRKRLGFGMWAKMHITGMHIEGKVLVGVKFLREWPFIGRLRVSFAEPPYFQMIVKPIFNHGIDVTELPGIAGWLDNLLAAAFEQSLVEPNMLVVDVEKFASSSSDQWFSMDEKRPIAFARVEVLEAADMKPSDLNGLADPYVKGQIGPFRFRTKIQKKTLFPKWHEEFKIPIFTWETPNELLLEVRDKDHLYDDTLGDCSVSVSERRGGERHDMWLNLQNIKIGRLHLAITVTDVDEKGGEPQVTVDKKSENKEELDLMADENKTWPDNNQFVNIEELPHVAENLEPINIEGLDKTGVWVHHPGFDTPKTWKPRKGRPRRPATKVLGENSSFRAGPGGVPCEDSSSSSDDENSEGGKRSTFIRGLHKISSVFHKSPKSETSSETFPSPVLSLTSHGPNIVAVAEKTTAVRIVLEDASQLKDTLRHKESTFAAKEEISPGKHHEKGVVKSILKHAGGGLKHVLSRKGSRKFKGVSELPMNDREIGEESVSTEDSLSSSKEFGVGVQVIHGTSLSDMESPDREEHLQKPQAALKEQEDKLSTKSESFEASDIEDYNVNKDLEKPVTVRKVSFDDRSPADHPGPGVSGSHEFEKSLKLEHRN